MRSELSVPLKIPAVPQLLAAHAVRIDHVALAVPDLETSITWCTQLLGCELVERRETAGVRSGMVSAVLKLGPVTLVLTQGTTPDSQVSRYLAAYGAGVTHVALEVRELANVVDELSAAGLEFSTKIIRGSGLFQIFTRRDPGTGMMFELIERHGGDFSNESVNELFRTLEQSDDF